MSKEISCELLPPSVNNVNNLFNTSDKSKSCFPPCNNHTENSPLTVIAAQKIQEIFSPDELDEYIDCIKEGFNYFDFPPLEAFERGLVDQKMIDKIRDGGTLLSVGVRLARLERLIGALVGENLYPGKIVLADIKFYPRIEREDFPPYFGKKVFDMTKVWPQFSNKFDFILFPESFGVAQIADKDGPPRTFRFHDIVQEVVKTALSKREKTEITSDDSLFIRLLETDAPKIKNKLNTIQNALMNLNDGGEIRMKGHLMNEQEIAYLYLRLNPAVEVSINKDGILFIKKSRVET